MIQVSHLTKYYGDFLAVNDLSFEIQDGHVYGFLGPNGAGKSTTMNIMTGCLSPTDGTVKIGGFDILEQPEAAKRLIGYLPEQPPLYPNETPQEYLTFVGEAKGLRGKELREEIDSAVQSAGIENVRDRLIGTLSKGYRQRVGIAQALLGKPQVIILDEPTVGLDPIQIIEIRDLIKELGKTHTVILSSHILSEVQAVCEKVLIISKGKLVLGTSADYAPSEFHTEINGTDTIVGFDVSIAQYMAEQLGVELEIVDMSFDNLLISLNKGDFDIVLAAMSSNEERAKAVDFSSEYYFSNNVILVQKQNADKYSTKESLQGVSMAAQKGTVCENRAKELAGEASVVSLVKVQDMVSELLAGKVEAVLLDKPVASGYVIMQDSLEMVDIGLVAEEGMSVAMKKNSAGLGELVNYLLSQLTEEQLDSWMGEAQVTAGVEE